MDAQKEIFKSSEGDQWFLRNKAAYETLKAKGNIVCESLESIEIQPKKILEIGCSNGIRLNDLQETFGAQCYGIDPSVSAIAEGSAKYPQLTLQVGTADSLPFDNDTFDLIVFGFCLCYCDRKDLFKIAMEADRCLSDSGYLTIMDFHPPIFYKNRYSHKDGLFVYKMDYSSLFSWNPSYTVVHQIVSSHSGSTMRHIPDERIAVTTLLKSETEAFPTEPYKG